MIALTDDGARAGRAGTEARRLSFELPADRVADAPIEARGGRRDDALLLVAHRDASTLDHRRFADLPVVLRAGDLLVANDSATLPAAVPSADGSVLHIATALPGGAWLVEVRMPCGAGSHPLPDVAPGQTFDLPGGVRLQVITPFSHSAEGVRLWTARPAPRIDRIRWLHRNGRPIRYGCTDRRWPLPAYQTAFSRRPGSAEMPSAARGFTTDLLGRLRWAGVELTTITLHTGVSSGESGERPHPEWFAVGRRAVGQVRSARREGRRVIAIGTTVVRALESAAGDDGRLRPASGWTDVIITPERGAPTVDGLVTGWHEPRASHLDLIEAVAGRELLERSYAAAIDGPYLWHEFGDFHLILPSR